MSHKGSEIFEVESTLVDDSMVVFIDNKTDRLLILHILCNWIGPIVILIGIAVEDNLLCVGDRKAEVFISPLVQLEQIFMIGDVVVSEFISLIIEYFLLLSQLPFRFGQLMLDLFVLLLILGLLYGFFLFVLLQYLVIVGSCFTLQIVFECLELLFIHLGQHFDDMLNQVIRTSWFNSFCWVFSPL